MQKFITVQTNNLNYYFYFFRILYLYEYERLVINIPFKGTQGNIAK